MSEWKNTENTEAGEMDMLSPAEREQKQLRKDADYLRAAMVIGIPCADPRSEAFSKKLQHERLCLVER